MINISKLKAFQDILNSWINIDSSELWDNDLLETKIINWFNHSLFDLVWNQFKIWNKPYNIKVSSITTTWKIWKNHFEADEPELSRLENFVDSKNKTFNKGDFLYYKIWNQYKKILVWDFQTKFIETIKYCPYCWIEQLKKWNKELDHFFPRALFPEFTYSLFNIIPSCHICNSKSYKWDKYFSQNWFYFHPYFWYLSYNDWFIIYLNDIKDLDDVIYFNQNQLLIYNNNLNIWEILEKWIESHLGFFSLEEKYKNSDSTSEELSDFNNKRNSIFDRINVYKTEQDKIDFIKNSFSNNWTKNWPFEKESVLISKNWKMRKDLYTWLIDECKKSNKI